jgi:hypothetical protein
MWGLAVLSFCFLLRSMFKEKPRKSEAGITFSLALNVSLQGLGDITMSKERQFHDSNGR